MLVSPPQCISLARWGLLRIASLVEATTSFLNAKIEPSLAHNVTVTGSWYGEESFVGFSFCFVDLLPLSGDGDLP